MWMLFSELFFNSLQDEHRLRGIADSVLFSLLIVLIEFETTFLVLGSRIFFEVDVTIDGVLHLLSSSSLPSFQSLGEDLPFQVTTEESICRILLLS